MKFSKFFKPAMLTSVAIILLAVVLSLFGRGMNLGLDFAGGLSMPYDLGVSAAQPDVAAVLGAEYSVSIQGAGKNEALVRIKSVGISVVYGTMVLSKSSISNRIPSSCSIGAVKSVIVRTR